MLNLTVMTGRLAEDPELRHTPNDTPVCTFRIAVRRDYAKKGGGEDTDFFDVVAWRHNAEFVCKYFTKGSLIQVSGRIENRRWEDKYEQPRVTAELIADKVYFGESKGNEGGGADIRPFAKSAEKGATDGLAANPASIFPPGFDPFA